MSSVAVIREGEGPEILLVHGGASPATTWSGLEPLSARWTLAYVHRRGYPPSPAPPGGNQDFDVDADDLAELLDDRPHLVAHSYGCLAAVIAASRAPERVRSLTLIEPPLYLDRDDPEVARLARMGDAVLSEGIDADPVVLREFLTLAGAPLVEGEPLPEGVVHGVRRAHGGRSPSQARPALDELRAARIPTLIASGAHSRALERICDTVAARLDAARVIAPGAGHFVAAAPGFGERLEEFLRASQSRSADPAGCDPQAPTSPR